jgi:hypothetical protein
VDILYGNRRRRNFKIKGKKGGKGKKGKKK